MAWTSLHRRKNRLEAGDEQTASFAMPPNGDWNAPEVAARVKAAAVAIKGRTSLALPSDQVLMRVVRFPTVDLGEIRDMAELQVDKFSPFPTDQMSIGQEILEQKDGASRVLIAAAPREVVEKRGAILQAAGVYPRDMDIEVLGWWRLLKQEKAVPEDGRRVVVLLDDASVELIVTENGVPVIVRALGALNMASPAEAATELAEEINYTLTSLEAEWGAGMPEALLLWHRADLPDDFLQGVRAASDAAVELHRLDALPPLSEGLARRAAERGPHVMDLAPPDWKTAIESRKLRRGILIGAGAFLALWLAGIAALVIGLQVEKRGLARAREALDKLQGPAKEVEQFRDQVASLERYADRTRSGLECLREVSALLPPGVDLTSFRYKKYDEVNLAGEAATGDPIYDFFAAIEKSGLFIEVKPEGVTQQQRGGQSRSQFRVTLEMPPEETDETVPGASS